MDWVDYALLGIIALVVLALATVAIWY